MSPRGRVVRWIADAIATGHFKPGDFDTAGGFTVGCNYWASHAGMYMWRRWDGAQVERDFDLLAAHGMKLLRVFPLWPDFQPLTGEYIGCGTLRALLQNGGRSRTRPASTTR